MKFTKTLAILAGCTLLSGSMLGCDPGMSTTYRDYLNAFGTVLNADGHTAAAGLKITSYNWVITFTDGSTVAEEFPLASVTTDAAGAFSFSSTKLALQSGNEAEYCTNVCLEYSTGYEDVCLDWESSYEDYCTDWEIDEDGYEYCANWETETTEYCAYWGTESYTYCSLYGEDCEYYYPSRSATDIKSAYAEITYSSGASTLTTQSQTTNYPATSIESVTTPEGDDHEIVDTKWNERDTFITPFASTARSAISAKRGTRPGSNTRKMRKAGTPVLGRTHKAARKLPAMKWEELTAAQRGKVEAARASCGAYPKELNK